MPVLQVKAVSKRYGARCTLKSISLELRQNECFGLIGLNGAGKTTLIKCILDLQALNAGEITINGVPHYNKRARNHLSYLAEKFNPPVFMSGYEYLHFFLQGHDSCCSEDEIHMLCSQLELDSGILQSPIKSYSKGTLQKLGIAACMLSGKKFDILDEPMSGLDPKSRVQFRSTLLEMKAQGKTILMSTHILHDIEKLCDKVGILHQGELRFVGTPLDCCKLYNAPDLEQAFLNCIENHKLNSESESQ